MKALLENPHASPVKEPFSALPDSVSVTLGVGSGPYQKTLAMSLLRAGMLKLPERYRESDLFVFPSVNEGLAQVLLEAMSSGLPVVASDHSGADELVTEGRDGFIVPVRDVDRLAEAIVWCYQHRRETQAMGRAARAKMESQFTLEHYNQRQIALYRSLATAAS